MADRRTFLKGAVAAGAATVIGVKPEPCYVGVDLAAAPGTDITAFMTFVTGKPPHLWQVAYFVKSISAENSFVFED